MTGFQGARGTSSTHSTGASAALPGCAFVFMAASSYFGSTKPDTSPGTLKRGRKGSTSPPKEGTKLDVDLPKPWEYLITPDVGKD